MKNNEWTSCGGEAVDHLWAERFFPEELNAAIESAQVETKCDQDFNWSGNTHTTSYEEIRVTVQGKTFSLHRNVSYGNGGYWQQNSRGDK